MMPRAQLTRPSQAVYHQGPISIFVSRAPGSVQDYDGSDGWRKLYDWGPTLGANGQSSWPMFGMFKGSNGLEIDWKALTREK